MKRKKRQMSIGAQVFWGKIFAGLLWTGAGVTKLFDGNMSGSIHIVILTAAVIMMVAVLKANREEDDEMSRENIVKAKAKTLDVMHCVFCIAAILAALGLGIMDKVEVNWPMLGCAAAFVLMGIQDVMTGIFFRRLEAE